MKNSEKPKHASKIINVTAEQRKDCNTNTTKLRQQQITRHGRKGLKEIKNNKTIKHVSTIKCSIRIFSSAASQ